MFHLPKMSQREQYTKQKLYEEAFNVSFNWEKYLSPKCFKFHDLTCREINSLISLQMGVMLPFVSACLGQCIIIMFNMVFLLGIEDKLISTNGYCIMIIDEGASFLSDLKRYETKHESYISLLNQLFDGKGDKMTLAKNVKRPVSRNATSLSIGVQQKSFCNAIFGLSETLWLDNGFGE